MTSLRQLAAVAGKQPYHTAWPYKSLFINSLTLFTMKTLNRMSLVLNSDQYHAGLMEVCRQFEGDHSDDYLNALVQDLAKANSSLLGAMHVEKMKRNVKQEYHQLMERLMATSRYIDSCAYVSDEAMKASAMALKQLLGTYDKPFARMKVDERVGAVSALLRDLSTAAMQKHVEKLPEMSGRIKGVQDALDALKVALHEVDKANGTVPEAQTKMTLKREAAAKLEKLVDYLKAMSLKDSAAYGEHYAVVTEVIARLNATRRRSNHLYIEVELEDDESNEPTEEPQTPTDDSLGKDN